MSVSAKQQAMIDRGLQLGMTLAQINRDPDYIAAGREHAKVINDAKLNYTADQWLEGNSGPFRSAKERENAMAVRVTNDRGRSVLLYDESREYRTAVQAKMDQSSMEVCGVMVKPDPLSPEKLLEAAEFDLYHKTRESLFTKASENNPDQVEAAQARLSLLQLGTDPQWQGIREKHERTASEERPYETWLKENGPVQVETMTTQAQADAANEANAMPKDFGPKLSLD